MGRGSTRPQQNTRRTGCKIKQNSKECHFNNKFGKGTAKQKGFDISDDYLTKHAIPASEIMQFRNNYGSAPGAFLEVLTGSWPTFVWHVGEPGKPHAASPMKISSL
ncbi:hypothetical protein NPIL_621151 [Nephila pilipes]|uniref:Uncharacterized protein n=1 Tax=Nephila pilipes TaxID=299642 RepID=A0A8X6Q1Q0_NEPPI|nr:hypothetical protein NPIL_621151 [Nephila pilipes]